MLGNIVQNTDKLNYQDMVTAYKKHVLQNIDNMFQLTMTLHSAFSLKEKETVYQIRNIDQSI